MRSIQGAEETRVQALGQVRPWPYHININFMSNLKQ